MRHSIRDWISHHLPDVALRWLRVQNHNTHAPSQATKSARSQSPATPHLLTARLGSQTSSQLASIGANQLYRETGLMPIKPTIQDLQEWMVDIERREELNKKADRQSSVGFRILFRNSTHGMLIVEPETGIILDSNAAFARLAKTEQKNTVGMFVEGFIVPDLILQHKAWRAAWCNDRRPIVMGVRAPLEFVDLLGERTVCGISLYPLGEVALLIVQPLEDVSGRRT